jgi:hypothetical protein
MGSPYSLSREGGLVTTDPTDQFLFVLNATSNTISVLSIDSSNGSLGEVPGSPVPSPTPPPGGGSAPSNPICMATFRSGTNSYLFVAYRNGPSPFTSAIVAFQIGTPSQPLTTVATTTLEATPVDMAISPKGNLYVALQHVPGSILEGQLAGVGILNMNSSPVQLSLVGFANYNQNEDSLVLNSAATVLFDGEGTSEAGFIETAQIRSDGTTLASQSLPVVSPNSPPSAMLVDGSGQLLFVQQGGQAAAYVINQTTGALSAPPTSTVPVPFNIRPGNNVAHPVEPYLYALQSGQIHVFEITDFTSGALVELTTSPTTIVDGAGSLGLVLTHNAINQAAPPYDAHLYPTSINFPGNTAVGLSVSDNSALLTNTGTQALNVTVSITGADQGDFKATNCPSPLATRTPCPITVTFTPTQVGVRQATLVVADGAGTQSRQLTGNGVASSSSGSGSGSGSSGSGGSGSGGSGSGGSGSGGSGSGGSGGTGGSGGSGNPPSSSQPTISVSSLSLSFTSPALNTAAPPQNIALTNNSSPTNSPAALQISSLQIIGPNASDFALGNNTCTNQPYAINLSCTPSVIFTPSALGSRFATLVITDNAVNSPQLIELSGLTQAEILTISPRPESNGSGYSQTVSAGDTANFPLLLSTTFNGTVSFSPCSGAPATATCTPPTPITVVANQPATFSIAITTVAASPSLTLLDELTRYRRRTGPSQITPSPIPQILFSTTCAFILLRRRRTSRCARPSLAPHNSSHLARHLAPRPFFVPASATITLAAFLALTTLTISSCGGASTVATAPTVTPTSASQTYTIIITPTAVTSDNSSVPNVQPIQLTLVVN